MTAVRVARARTVRANSLEQIQRMVDEGAITSTPVWVLLFLRPMLALAMQATFAVGFAIANVSDPWREAADWWLVSFALAEMANLWLLRRLARNEGIRLRDLYNPWRRATRGADLRWLLLGLLVAGPIAFLPNVLLGGSLWGDAQAGSDLIFRTIPISAAWLVLFIFPVVHALTELPTYFGYVMPRLQVLRQSRWPILVICGAVLSAQHLFMPLLFDGRYIVWRLLMFLPFALWLAWLIDRRPTTLPYLMTSHALLDVSLPLFVLLASS